MFQLFIDFAISLITTIGGGKAVYLSEKKDLERREIIQAIGRLELAINATARKIRDAGYVPDEKLSDMWLEVATLFENTDPGIAGTLRAKATFWDNPRLVLNEEIHVPKLEELKLLIHQIRTDLNTA